MHGYIPLCFVMVCTACGSHNIAKKNSLTTSSTIDRALQQLEQNQPAKAFQFLMEALGASKKNFILHANPFHPNFTKQMTELFSISSEEEATQVLPLIVQAGLGKEGIDLVDFTRELLALDQPRAESNDSHSASPLGNCSVDPGLQRLINAARKATALGNIGIYQQVAVWSAFQVDTATAAKAQAPTRLYRLRPTTTSALVILTGLASLATFSLMMRQADRDHDYKISPQEAENFFTADSQGNLYAHALYELLAVMAHSISSLVSMREISGGNGGSLKAAFVSILSYQEQLANTILFTNNHTIGSAQSCGSARTLTSSRSCVRQWLVAKTNCAQ